MLLRRSLILAAAFLSAAPAAFAADSKSLGKSGVLRVAVYKHFHPFYYDETGEGIDVDIARAVAKALDLEVSILPFDADESVDDDLRNMVWRGSLAGYGPADLMLHVPVDKRLMAANDKVLIFSPYLREKLQVARNTEKIPEVDGVLSLEGHLVGTEDASLGSMVLLGEGGAVIREKVRHFPTVRAAAEAMKKGELDAVVGQRSELQAALGTEAHVEVGPLRARTAPPNGWVVGMSVRKEDEALAKAVDGVIKEMARSGQLKAIFAKHGVEWMHP